MFVGHYGVSLAAKRYRPELSLGVLFLAVQFLDVLFAVFVLTGVEKMRIVHGFTAYNPYDLYWMPYSHSLLGAIVWSAAAGIGCFLWMGGGRKGGRAASATVLAAAVFSHFLLDVPMHAPDLPLTLRSGSQKIGLGLWNHRAAAVLAELAVLVIGGAVYLRASRARNRGTRIATRVFACALVALTIATPFLPDPPSAEAFAVQALVLYVLLSFAAAWVDRRRELETTVS
ncbi:MAG TPA: hypothetical protein VKJ00_03210 [Thermoanaerobaculia bacterium]|nr:hypothetical protein [Thermoanaerobaculia bacterium]